MIASEGPAASRRDAALATLVETGLQQLKEMPKGALPPRCVAASLVDALPQLRARLLPDIEQRAVEVAAPIQGPCPSGRSGCKESPHCARLWHAKVRVHLP